MMTALPMVKGKMGLVTGIKKEHGKHSPSHGAAAPLSLCLLSSNHGLNPLSHPTDLPFNKDIVSSVRGSGGRV